MLNNGRMEVETIVKLRKNKKECGRVSFVNINADLTDDEINQVVEMMSAVTGRNLEYILRNQDTEEWRDVE